jgi:REP element-mobilizing transposase RayT
MGPLLAHFLTWTCYGTWTRGRAPGWIDGKGERGFGASIEEPDPILARRDMANLSEPPFLMDAPLRRVALDAMLALAGDKGWNLLAAHVRANHVHVVVSGMADPARGMAAFKARITRDLRAAGVRRERYWTRHGSTRHIFDPAKLDEVLDYVISRQGVPMAWTDGAEAHYG